MNTVYPHVYLKQIWDFNNQSYTGPVDIFLDYSLFSTKFPFLVTLPSVQHNSSDSSHLHVRSQLAEAMYTASLHILLTLVPHCLRSHTCCFLLSFEHTVTLFNVNLLYIVILFKISFYSEHLAKITRHLCVIYHKVSGAVCLIICGAITNYLKVFCQPHSNILL